MGRDKVVYGNSSATTGISGNELNQLFLPLMNALRDTPPERRAEAVQKVEALKHELTKSKGADDRIVAGLIESIVALVPSGVSTVVRMFASPILAEIAGPVTTFVLDRIQGK